MLLIVEPPFFCKRHIMCGILKSRTCLCAFGCVLVSYINNYKVTYIHSFIHPSIRICMYNTEMYINIHDYVHKYVCKYTHAYIYLYIHTCQYIHTHIYKHIVCINTQMPPLYLVIYIRKRRKWVFRRKSITKKKIFIKTFLCLFQPSVPRGKAMAIAPEKNNFGAIRTSLFLWANQRSRVPQPFCLNTMTVFRIWKENIHASKDTVRIMQSGETDIIWLR